MKAAGAVYTRYIQMKKKKWLVKIYIRGKGFNLTSQLFHQTFQEKKVH